jgi:hypothetical protein
MKKLPHTSNKTIKKLPFFLLKTVDWALFKRYLLGSLEALTLFISFGGLNNKVENAIFATLSV